jgi:hypothetical protein
MYFKRKIAIVGLFFTGFACAQDGPSEIRITGSNNLGQFTCYATACLDDSISEKQARLRNARNVVEIDCNTRSSSFVQRRCDKSKDEYSSMETCFADVCARATCRTSEVGSNKCVSRSFFRQ